MGSNSATRRPGPPYAEQQLLEDLVRAVRDPRALERVPVQLGEAPAQRLGLAVRIPVEATGRARRGEVVAEPVRERVRTLVRVQPRRHVELRRLVRLDVAKARDGGAAPLMRSRRSCARTRPRGRGRRGPRSARSRRPRARAVRAAASSISTTEITFTKSAARSPLANRAVPAGREHVVRGDAVVAERDRREGADEDRAGVPDPVRERARRPRAPPAGARARGRSRPRRPARRRDQHRARVLQRRPRRPRAARRVATSRSSARSTASTVARRRARRASRRRRGRARPARRGRRRPSAGRRPRSARGRARSGRRARRCRPRR